MNRRFHQYERGGSVERGRDMEAHQHNRIRSRTPGPDFMRRRDDDLGMDSRVPQPPRSKTPTHDHNPQYQHHASSLSGTPDFIPASQYPTNNGTGPGPDLMYRGQYGQGYPPPDHMYSNSNMPPPRLNSSQSFGSALNSHQAPNRTNYSPQISPQILDPSARLNPPPRKQSTSFEHVEPAPSNLTRIPPHRGGGGGMGGTAYEDEWLEMTVFLTRQESGFGFRIIGGTEEGSQVRDGSVIFYASYMLS